MNRYGRLDNASGVAAIQRIQEVAASHQAVTHAVQQVLDSPAFRSSKRSREFLRYVVENALAGRLEYLKERSIGVALLGREPTYDTGADASVRVAANDVRRRLDQYYADSGATASIVFHLPAGSYVPEINVRFPQVRPQPEEVTAPPPDGARRKWIAFAVAGWTLAILALAAWALTGVSRRTAAPGVGVLPWVSLFHDSSEPQLVVADSGMGMLSMLSPLGASVEDYANLRFMEPPTGLPGKFPDLWRGLAEKRLTSLADVRIATRVERLAALNGRRLTVSFARELHVADFRQGRDFILLGSDSANPWVDLFQDRLSFQIVTDRNLGGQVVHIRDSRPGEPSFLGHTVSSGRTGDAFAAAALVPGLDGTGRVLILQGTNMEGTDLAGEFVLNTDSFLPELARCGVGPSNPRASFEFLLRLRSTAGSISKSEIVARRCR